MTHSNSRYPVLHTFAAQDLRIFWQNNANHHDFGEAATVIFQLVLNAVYTLCPGASTVALTGAYKCSFIYCYYDGLLRFESPQKQAVSEHLRLFVFGDCKVSIMPTTGDVIAMGSILPILDVMAVALRFFAKRQRTRCGVDDYLILFSLVNRMSATIWN